MKDEVALALTESDLALDVFYEGLSRHATRKGSGRVDKCHYQGMTFVRFGSQLTKKQVGGRQSGLFARWIDLDIALLTHEGSLQFLGRLE